MSDENFFSDLIPEKKPEEQQATDIYGQPITDVEGKPLTEIKPAAPAAPPPEQPKAEPEKKAEPADGGIFSDLIPKEQPAAAKPTTEGGATVRVMAYGPIEGEYHRAANFGPKGNRLQPYDIAVSPNLGLNLGEWIDLNGKPYRVADWSYRAPGVPTKNAIEVRDTHDQGHGKISLIGSLSPAEIQKRIAEFPAIAGDVTGQALKEARKEKASTGIFSDLVPAEGAPPPAKGAPPPTDTGMFSDLVPPAPVKIEEPPPPAPEPTPAPEEEEPPAAAAAAAAATPQAQPQQRPPLPGMEPPPAQPVQPLPSVEEAAQIPSFEEQEIAPVAPPATGLDYFAAKAGVPAEQAIAMAPAEQQGVVRNAYQAAIETGQEFIPTSLEAVNKMLEPAINAPAEIRKGYDAVNDFIQGKPINDIIKQRVPESQLLVEADKTPAFSKERFKAGYQVAAQLLMAKGLGKQIKAGVVPKGVPKGEKEQPSAAAPAAAAPAAAPAPLPVSREIPGVPPTGGRPIPAVKSPPETPPGPVPQTAGEFVTSTKNAVVDAERQARGLSPILNEVTQSHPEVMAEAEARMTANPDYARALTSDIVTGKTKGVDAIDEAVLLREKIRLQNERAVAGERANDTTLTDTERALATERFQEAENQISNIDVATKESGAAWGRMGAFRQRLARDDYSLVTVESRMRIAKGNKPLTEDELATLTKQVNELQKATADMQAKQAKLIEGGKQLSPRDTAKVNRLGKEIEDLKARLDPLHRLRQEVIKRYEELDRRLARERGLAPRPPTTRAQLPRVEDLDIQALQTELNKVKAIKAERAALRRMNEGLDRQIARMKGIDPRIEKKLAGKVEADLETEALQTELDRLKAMQKEARAARHDMNRLAARKERLERRVAGLKGLEPAAVRRPRSPITDLEVEALQTELSRLVEQKFQENRLPQAKERIDKRIKILEERIGNYGYAQEVRREPVKPDRELREKQYRVAAAKEKINRGLVEARWKNQDDVQRFFGNLGRTATLPRALEASLDQSYLLRQGKISLMSRPITTIRTFGETLKAGFGTRYSEAFADVRARLPERGGLMGWKRPFQILNAASERGFNDIQEAIRSDPLYYESKYEGGVSYTDVEPGAKLRQMEEVFQSAWADAIPGVRESQRMYVAFLNKLRLESYKALRGSLGNNGEFTPIQAKLAGNYVNIVTGRGNLEMFGKDFEAASVAMAQVFFAPRYRVSRFQYISGQPLWHLEHLAEGRTPGAKQMRNVIAGEYARAMAGFSVYYSLYLGALKAFGVKSSVQTDPRSSDWGKIKIGNVRIDPLAGLAQATTFMARTLTGETFTQAGEKRSIRGAVPYGHATWGDVAKQFVRGGLAPIPAALYDTFEGRDFSGQPVTLSDTAVKLISPMSGKDMVQSMKEQGFTPGAALSVLSLLGESVQTYSPRTGRGAGGVPMMLAPPPPPPPPPMAPPPPPPPP